MTDTAWVALASLACFVLVQGAIACFMAGGVFARLKRVETDAGGASALALQVAALTATMKGFEAQLEHFSETLREVLTQASPAGRGGARAARARP
jgi:hypothetical protein